MVRTTRGADLKERDMLNVKRAPPRGLIGKGGGDGVTHARYEVPAPLDALIEHFWSVRWDLDPGVRLERQTLPHPCFHVVVEDGVAEVSGVPRARFVKVLEGRGQAFGVKFWPGGFRGLLDGSAAELTGRVVPLADVLGEARARRYERAITRARDDGARVRHATALFTRVLPLPPADFSTLHALVQAAMTDRTLTTVEALRARSGMHLRDLQRWFRDTIGVNPKWLIQRYRLHEALAALEHRHATVAAIAAELGYADQAHFARDFRRVVGLSPSRYAALFQKTCQTPTL
jgi:AraC-like DNA-binding protein